MPSPRSRPARHALAALLAARLLAGRLLSACVLAACLGGCLAPTLPLPPPEGPDTVGMLESGSWELRGSANVGATVIAVVERTGTGAVVEDRDANGRYRLEVEGERCDVVEVWQQDGDETSARTRVVLQETENGRVVDPDACTR